MHEPITVEVERGCGDGAHRSNPINFIGHLVKTVEGGQTTIRLYEWANRGRLAYLVHVEEDKPGRPPGTPSTRSSTPTRPGPPPRSLSRSPITDNTAESTAASPANRIRPPGVIASPLALSPTKG